MSMVQTGQMGAPATRSAGRCAEVSSARGCQGYLRQGVLPYGIIYLSDGQFKAVLLTGRISCMQDGWEHLPHDLLVAVVKHLEPEDARSMHRVCRSWHLAVRCGLQGMKPSAKLTPFPDIRDYFPRVRIRTAEDRRDHALQRDLSARGKK